MPPWPSGHVYDPTMQYTTRVPASAFPQGAKPGGIALVVHRPESPLGLRVVHVLAVEADGNELVLTIEEQGQLIGRSGAPVWPELDPTQALTSELAEPPAE